MSGIFITFEGVEGCGKSTQTRLLRDRLAGSGRRVVLTREPGSGEFGNRIREVLLHTSHAALEPLAELFLLEADRTQHVAEIIRPALADDAVVICDRHADSSIAYQGFGRSLPVDFIEQLNGKATGGLDPDRTFILDLDAASGLARSRNRLIQQDMFDREGRFENESVHFHRKVREGYLAIARAHPQRVSILDGTLSIDELAAIIWDDVCDLLDRQGDRSS